MNADPKPSVTKVQGQRWGSQELAVPGGRPGTGHKQEARNSWRSAGHNSFSSSDLEEEEEGDQATR